MNHVLRISVAVAALLAAFAAGAADVGKADADKGEDAKAVEGMWRPIKAELGGQAMDEAILKSISMKLEGGRYEVLVGDKPDKGTYTLDPAATPRGITVTGTDGPNKGKTFPAIYELGPREPRGRDDADGQTLRICYDLSGAKRPTEFKTAAGTKLYLVTYARGKE